MRVVRTFSLGLVALVACAKLSAVSLAQSGDPGTQPGPFVVAPEDSILSEYTPQVPPNPNPPRYTLLRFNEDYSYLADPKDRTDLFDPLKYIPLNPDDRYSYLSLGGAIRERYEHYTNQNFGLPGEIPRNDY